MVVINCGRWPRLIAPMCPSRICCCRRACAFFVSDLIDQLDLSAITTVYEDEERGYPPYHPVMLTKVLVYAYCVGIFSSRRIQRRLVEDVGFRLLAAGNEPDFRTIADFRKRHL